MKLENYIHVENNAISTDFCDEIIKEYDEPDDWKPGTITVSYTHLTLPTNREV